VATAAINQIPGELGWTSGFTAPGFTDDDGFLIKGLPSDASVVEALGVDVLAGRAFPAEPPEPDSTNFQFILNATAVEKVGWTPEEAVGQRVAVDSRQGEVIGVVGDFHFRSLHEAVEPLAIWYQPVHANHLAVRLAPGDTRAAMDHLEAVWGRFAAHRPFAFRFLDDVYDRLYRNERQVGQVVSVFAFLAIFVACLGLFGLAAFTAEQRTKEIGVRKVLGATVPNLVGLLTKDFVVLVLVAFAVAVPVAWLAMSTWLDGFAYRIEVGPGVFATTALLLLVIALATVGTQALRAATADPVQSLRSE
jgi:putative ABC transport system permease protein